MAPTPMTHSMPLWGRLRRSVGGLLLVAILLAGGLGCQSESEGVQSHLEGQVSVRSSVDSSGDYGGFRVLVVQAQGRSLDTLGQAVTGPAGRYEMTVTAPERGLYPLTIW